MPKSFKAIPIRIEACFKCQRPLLFSFSGNLKKKIIVWKEVMCLGGAYARKYSVIMLIFCIMLNYLEQKATLIERTF